MHEVHVVHPKQVPPAPPDVHDEEDLPAPSATFLMPGGAERVAEEIREASPEGTPADPKVGPAGLWTLIALSWLLIAATAVGLGLWFDWVLGAAVLGLGTMAMFANPVLYATSSRAKERREVLEHHQPHPHG